MSDPVPESQPQKSEADLAEAVARALFKHAERLEDGDSLANIQSDLSSVLGTTDSTTDPAQPARVVELLSLHVATQLDVGSAEARDTLLEELAALAAFTPYDAIDRVAERVASPADYFARISERIQTANEPIALRASLLLALSGAKHPLARERMAQLSGKELPPLLSRLAAPGPVASETELRGELTPRRHGPIATVLLALTGLLFIARGLRAVGRVAFSWKRPAAVQLSEEGLRIEHRIEMLGRTLRDRSELVPVQNLASVMREVRYSRLGLYAGLAALVLGTYLGVGLLVDGVRAPGGSPSLLGLGVLCIILGLGLDFFFASFFDSVRGKCQLVVVERSGRTLSIGALEAEGVDRLLRRFAERIGVQAPQSDPAPGPAQTQTAQSEPVG